MSTDTTIISRRKRQEFTVGAKMTLTALTVMGFIGTWNIIARLESQAAAAMHCEDLRGLRRHPGSGITGHPCPGTLIILALGLLFGGLQVVHTRKELISALGLGRI